MRQDIEFESEGVTCRGWLFTPDAGEAAFPVCSHGYGRWLCQGIPHYVGAR